MKKAAIVFAIPLLTSCAGWFPGRQAYWDAQIKQMCAKDGGLTVYERVPISRAEVSRHVLPTTADGRLGFTIKDLAHPDAPVYSVESVTILRDWGPSVSRTEAVIIRRADQVVVGKWVRYSRSGGDMPTGFSEGTSFICPDLQQVTSDVHNRLFLIEGNSK
jgi:hypothetical protein